ncbi:hypothetical protein HK102_013333 [Quaeritorhiza haematococci]|nr:hypothetical protein HK102_013333 [Quaeritorhiza haematococci]
MNSPTYETPSFHGLRHRTSTRRHDQTQEEEQTHHHRDHSSGTFAYDRRGGGGGAGVLASAFHGASSSPSSSVRGQPPVNEEVRGQVGGWNEWVANERYREEVGAGDAASVSGVAYGSDDGDDESEGDEVARGTGAWTRGGRGRDRGRGHGRTRQNPHQEEWHERPPADEEGDELGGNATTTGTSSRSRRSSSLNWRLHQASLANNRHRRSSSLNWKYHHQQQQQQQQHQAYGASTTNGDVLSRSNGGGSAFGFDDEYDGGVDSGWEFEEGQDQYDEQVQTRIEDAGGFVDGDIDGVQRNVALDAHAVDADDEDPFQDEISDDNDLDPFEQFLRRGALHLEELDQEHQQQQHQQIATFSGENQPAGSSSVSDHQSFSTSTNVFRSGSVQQQTSLPTVFVEDADVYAATSSRTTTPHTLDATLSRATSASPRRLGVPAAGNRSAMATLGVIDDTASSVSSFSLRWYDDESNILRQNKHHIPPHPTSSVSPFPHFPTTSSSRQSSYSSGIGPTAGWWGINNQYQQSDVDVIASSRAASPTTSDSSPAPSSPVYSPSSDTDSSNSSLSFPSPSYERYAHPPLVAEPATSTGVEADSNAGDDAGAGGMLPPPSMSTRSSSYARNRANAMLGEDDGVTSLEGNPELEGMDPLGFGFGTFGFDEDGFEIPDGAMWNVDVARRMGVGGLVGAAGAGAVADNGTSRETNERDSNGNAGGVGVDGMVGVARPRPDWYGYGWTSYDYKGPDSEAPVDPDADDDGENQDDGERPVDFAFTPTSPPSALSGDSSQQNHILGGERQVQPNTNPFEAFDEHLSGARSSAHDDRPGGLVGLTDSMQEKNQRMDSDRAIFNETTSAAIATDPKSSASPEPHPTFQFHTTPPLTAELKAPPSPPSPLPTSPSTPPQESLLLPPMVMEVPTLDRGTEGNEPRKPRSRRRPNLSVKIDNPGTFIEEIVTETHQTLIEQSAPPNTFGGWAETIVAPHNPPNPDPMIGRFHVETHDTSDTDSTGDESDGVDMSMPGMNDPFLSVYDRHLPLSSSSSNAPVIPGPWIQMNLAMAMLEANQGISNGNPGLVIGRGDTTRVRNSGGGHQTQDRVLDEGVFGERGSTVGVGGVRGGEMMSARPLMLSSSEDEDSDEDENQRQKTVNGISAASHMWSKISPSPPPKRLSVGVTAANAGPELMDAASGGGVGGGGFSREGSSRGSTEMVNSKRLSLPFASVYAPTTVTAMMCMSPPPPLVTPPITNDASRAMASSRHSVASSISSWASSTSSSSAVQVGDPKGKDPGLPMGGGYDSRIRRTSLVATSYRKGSLPTSGYGYGAGPGAFRGSGSNSATDHTNFWPVREHDASETASRNRGHRASISWLGDGYDSASGNGLPTETWRVNKSWGAGPGGLTDDDGEINRTGYFYDLYGMMSDDEENDSGSLFERFKGLTAATPTMIGTTSTRTTASKVPMMPMIASARSVGSDISTGNPFKSGAHLEVARQGPLSASSGSSFASSAADGEEVAEDFVFEDSTDSEGELENEEAITMGMGHVNGGNLDPRPPNRWDTTISERSEKVLDEQCCDDGDDFDGSSALGHETEQTFQENVQRQTQEANEDGHQDTSFCEDTQLGSPAANAAPLPPLDDQCCVDDVEVGRAPSETTQPGHEVEQRVENVEREAQEGEADCNASSGEQTQPESPTVSVARPPSVHIPNIPGENTLLSGTTCGDNDIEIGMCGEGEGGPVQEVSCDQVEFSADCVEDDGVGEVAAGTEEGMESIQCEDGATLDAEHSEEGISCVVEGNETDQEGADSVAIVCEIVNGMNVSQNTAAIED